MVTTCYGSPVCFFPMLNLLRLNILLAALVVAGAATMTIRDPFHSGHGQGHPGSPETLFGMLARGKSLGKRVNLAVEQGTDFGSFHGASEVNLLELRGPDDAAQNIQLTLTPPKVIPVNASFTLAQARDAVQKQNASGAQSLSDLAGFLATPMVARLKWGVGGIDTDVVEVDISNGLCLNLTASFLRVGVASDPLVDLLGIGGGSSAVYELGGFAGPGYTKPNNGQRTVTFHDTPAPGGTPFLFGTTPVVPIPKYATRCRLTMSPGAALVSPVALSGWIAQVVFMSEANLLYVAGQDPSGWSMLSVHTIADNGNGSSPVDIPNGAYYAAVVNMTSQPIIPVLTFELGI